MPELAAPISPPVPVGLSMESGDCGSAAPSLNLPKHALKEESEGVTSQSHHGLPDVAHTGLSRSPISKLDSQLINVGEPVRGVANYVIRIVDTEQGDVHSSSLFTWLNRKRMRGRFLEIMDREMGQGVPFTDLFDNGGLVRPWHIENTYHKGTGLWGIELNDGNLLYVHDLDVSSPFAHRCLFDMAATYTSYDDSILVQPQCAEEVAFYLKSGFRRIGRTAFLAYPLRLSDPSRYLPADAEWNTMEDVEKLDPVILLDIGEKTINPYHFPYIALSADEQQIIFKLRKERYPVHAAIDKYRAGEIEKRIKHYHEQQPDAIHDPDDHGVRPILAAVIRRNVAAVRTLLSLGVTEDATCRENTYRLTPLEWNAREMTRVREHHLRPGSNITWSGAEDQRLEIQWLLKRRRKKKMRVGEETLQGYMRKRKWGCTCGRCLGGWLSPSMLDRLKEQTIKTFAESAITTKRTLASDILNVFLPLELKRGGLSSRFYSGYRLVFREIHEFLDSENLSQRAEFEMKIGPAASTAGSTSLPALAPRIPPNAGDSSLAHPERIVASLARYLLPSSARARQDTIAISYFTAHGGKPDFALDCLFFLVQHDNVTESATAEVRDVNSASPATPPASPCTRAKFPRCANDYAYELVRERMGLSRAVQWGPYLEKPKVAKSAALAIEQQERGLAVASASSKAGQPKGELTSSFKPSEGRPRNDEAHVTSGNSGLEGDTMALATFKKRPREDDRVESTAFKRQRRAERVPAMSQDTDIAKSTTGAAPTKSRGNSLTGSARTVLPLHPPDATVADSAAAESAASSDLGRTKVGRHLLLSAQIPHRWPFIPLSSEIAPKFGRPSLQPSEGSVFSAIAAHP